MIGSVGANFPSYSSAAQSSALTPEQQRQLAALKKSDRQVKAHEQAHAAAGAGLVGGGSFEYKAGPDNKRYAVGGEVSIDVSPGRTPDATIAKAQQIRAAALAPADPSVQDRRVAAEATQMEMQARAEMARQPAEAATSENPVNSAIAAYRQIAAAQPGSSSFQAQA
ncbi:MAG TPA: putative metalloprotease CJM1_0395 family protein [Azonexus sp.]|nr:putative metalloprotease CJM1_0395 family protein [Azonexus sp.]